LVKSLRTQKEGTLAATLDLVKRLDAIGRPTSNDFAPMIPDFSRNLRKFRKS
jgi:hypothetical protein